jgi:hypothetical protein
MRKEDRIAISRHFYNRMSGSFASVVTTMTRSSLRCSAEHERALSTFR